MTACTWSAWIGSEPHLPLKAGDLGAHPNPWHVCPWPLYASNLCCWPLCASWAWELRWGALRDRGHFMLPTAAILWVKSQYRRQAAAAPANSGLRTHLRRRRRRLALRGRRGELQVQDFAPPAAPLHLAQLSNASRCFFVAGPTDWGGDIPHPSPQRQFFCLLSGELEAIASDGETRRFGPGGLLLLEDTTGAGHATRVVGGTDFLIFGVALAG